MTAAELDQDQVDLFAFKVWSFKQGEVVSTMVHLGDRLGLYRAMAGAGPLTAQHLADSTGFHPRWLLEWLRNQAAAELIHSENGEVFELTAVQAAVLADEEGSLAFAAGAFGPPRDAGFYDDLAECFRTGRGMPYDRLGVAGAHQCERQLAPWARIALIPVILPALDGVTAKLEAGAKVADIGCGAGLALRVMAAAYPVSTFHGFDLSKHAIELARSEAEPTRLTNLEFHQARGEEVPAGSDFDFILTFDCLHDMTRPAEALAALRNAIADDGTLLVKEVKSSADFNRNRRNPMLAMMYGFSVQTCMSSGLSEPGGAGLGTMGINPEVAQTMCEEAGFSRFRLHDFADPANLYYEVRP